MREPGEAITVTIERETLAGAAAALAAVVGSVGPWASVGPIAVAGTRGDGVITLLAAVLAAFLILTRRAPLLTLLLGFVVAAVSIYDLVDITNVASDTPIFSVSAGWGIYLTAIGGIGLLAVAAIQQRARAAA